MNFTKAAERRKSRAATTQAIEILGPPGAGKSELVDALCELSQDVGLVDTYFRASTLIPWMRAAVKLSPLLATPSAGGRAFRRRAWMIRLQASSSIMRRVRSHASVLVFDQGPLYTLARLREVAPQGVRTARWERWWEEMVSTWAHLVDIVVFLDARDEELLIRISGRPKKHLIEDYAEGKARERLNHSRQLYKRVVQELQERGDVRVLRLDTSNESVDQVAADVMAALKLGLSDGHARMDSARLAGKELGSNIGFDRRTQ